MTTQTAYERLVRVRRRKKLGLVAVTIPARSISIDIPEDRVDEVLAMAVEVDE